MTIDVAKLREANDDMEHAMSELVRGVMMRAQLARAKYLSLVKVGFSEAQAIELCRTDSPLL